MSTRSITRIATHFISLVCVCLGLLYMGLQLSHSPSAILDSATETSNTWQTVVQISSNAVSQWRYGPIAQLLSEFGESVFPNAEFGTRLSFVLSLFFGLGAALVVAQLSTASWSAALALGLSTSILLPLSIGYDPLTLAAVCCLPLLVFALIQVREESHQSLALGILLLTSIVHTSLAQQLSLLVALIALAIATAISARVQGQHGDTNFFVSFWGIATLIALLTPAVISVFATPQLLLPDYPVLSHVVPDDNLPGHIGALIGPSSSIPIIDRDSLKHFFSPVIWVLLTASLFCGVLAFNTPYRKLGMLTVTLAVITALDIVTPEAIAQISPLATLGRIVPGMFFICLAPIFAAICLFLSGILLPLAGSTTRAIAGVSSVALVTLFAFEFGYEPERIRGRIAKEARVQELAEVTPKYVRAKLSTPSLRIIDEYRGRPLMDRATFMRDDYIALSPAPTLQVSANALDSRLMIDGKPDTAWNSGASSQDGTEWISIILPEQTTLDGIELSTGTLRWDFPRRLEIQYSSDCSSSEANYEPIVADSTWQGRVLYSDEELPYYGGQDDVKVVFPKTISAKCLRIRQTGTHPHFRWSVAELRFLLAKEFP